jgi:dTDP-4-amino-4,6-dideoxygalactose transaminase
MKTKLAIHGGRPVQKSGKIKSAIGKEELLAAKNVVKGGVLSSFRGGNEVRSFESSFAEYVGASNGLATTSGTTALHTCVAALGLTPNDEVLVPALTFVSTASVVVQESAKVVFVDVGDDYCMDPGDLERKITPRSKAVIPVHLYGRPAPMDEIRKIAKKFNLVVIEDACQSHGATYKDSKTGSLGDAGCFSFFQTKNMTCGEGGMITTSSADYYDKLCQRREHGSPRSSTTWYNYEVLGYNYNMTEVQGAIGKVQLAKLDTMNNARIANAKLYDESLGGLDRGDHLLAVHSVGLREGQDGVAAGLPPDPDPAACLTERDRVGHRHGLRERPQPLHLRHLAPEEGELPQHLAAGLPEVVEEVVVNLRAAEAVLAAGEFGLHLLVKQLVAVQAQEAEEATVSLVALADLGFAGAEVDRRRPAPRPASPGRACACRRWLVFARDLSESLF